MTAARLPTVNPDGSWTFAGKVLHVVDGDTCDVELYVDTGHDETATRRRRIRILGIDAPEVSTPEGKAARTYARLTWEGCDVLVTVVKPDKYGGRDDGNITSPLANHDWARDIIAAGHAKPYNGGPRGETT